MAPNFIFFCVCVRSWVSTQVCVCVCFFFWLVGHLFVQKALTYTTICWNEPTFRELVCYFRNAEQHATADVCCANKTIGVLDAIIVCLSVDSREPPSENCAAFMFLKMLVEFLDLQKRREKLSGVCFYGAPRR